MANTVFILGAGFSHSAGIPLLGGMLPAIIRGARDRTLAGRALRPEDAEILAKAVDVRNSMDRYHGRAQFDDRNIEDVLSLLAFEALRLGGTEGRDNLEAMTRAIGRAIELTCSVQHPGIGFEERDVFGRSIGPDVYREFWMSLLTWYGRHRKLPTIISLNYDLVLERSLLQVLNGPHHYGRDARRSFSTFQIDYGTPYAPRRPFVIEDRTFADTGQVGIVVNDARTDANVELTVEILKLHGSLNFSAAAPQSCKHFNMAAAVNDPQILPPIFNKTRQGHFDGIWGTALARLAAAHNIVVVGYSLPATDMYMQFFLKAALGPNTNIERIVVFDPLLHAQGGGRDLRGRYAACFAQQTQRLIEFTPEARLDREHAGTCTSFVRALESAPDSLMS